MLARLPLVAVCLAVAGCADMKITAPVEGRLSDGRAMFGVAIAHTNGDGRVSVTLPGGITCAGDYDSLSLAKQFVVPIVCDDGRTGSAAVERRPGGMSGTADVTLSDGTTGRFAFGNLSYDAAFPAEPAAKP